MGMLMDYSPKPGVQVGYWRADQTRTYHTRNQVEMMEIVLHGYADYISADDPSNLLATKTVVFPIDYVAMAAKSHPKEYIYEETVKVPTGDQPEDTDPADYFFKNAIEDQN